VFIHKTCFGAKIKRFFAYYSENNLHLKNHERLLGHVDYGGLYRDLNRGLLYSGHTGGGRLVILEFFVLA